MTHHLILLTLLATLIAACGTTDQRQISETARPDEYSGSNRQRMEEAIARRILGDIALELPALPLSEQPAFLRDKKQQFESSVDLELTSERIRHEKGLLDYLHRQADFRLYGSGYLPRLQEKTSLDWSLAEFTDQINDELHRLDQTIAVLADTSPEDFNLTDYMTQRRNSDSYLADNFDGRQQYLDGLADAMLDVQLNWYDILENYSESVLAIYGEEDMDQMFRFTPEGLTINLSQVENLPMFELKPLAVYYGFPGLSSVDTEDTNSLKQFLKIPGYNHGWAAYAVEAIGVRDTDHTIDYLLFSRALVAMAQADVYINTGVWSRQQAKMTLLQTLPYSANRIELMLHQAIIDPGQYAAAIAGKRVLAGLQQQCLASGRGDACHSVFNQRIVDWGPIPFSLLEQRLF